MNDEQRKLIERMRSLDTEQVNDAGRNLNRVMILMAPFLGSLADDAERLTRDNLAMQASVVSLTKRLFWLTLALAMIAAAQIYLAAQQLKVAQAANTLIDNEQNWNRAQHQSSANKTP